MQKAKNERLKITYETVSNLCLNFRGNDLDVVQEVKYLGLQVDFSLDREDQIKALRLLKHAKTFLPESSLRSLYLRIVEPHFRYC